MAKVRFLFDEHIPPAVARALRVRSIDVLTAQEAGLIGAPDNFYLERVRETGRVLLTHDSDFLRLHHQREQHNGIVYAAQHSRTIGAMVTGLILICELLDSEEMIGRVEFL